MFRISRHLAQAAEFISRHEFLDAIAEVCPAAAATKHNGGLPLALAVSGGVDSMALSLMCREYLPENGTTLHALVVDHGLRSASYDEATKVKQVLRQRLRIPAQILPISLHEFPLTATNVETFARKLRFPALGRACKDLGASLLLLGHHADDQAETLLMRLVDGSTAKLTGMQKIANIPECHGLHGISESGSCHAIEPSRLPRDCGVTGLERGGVRIARPLLDFSKSRLLATCQKFEMPWFEDETNRDRTLTSRNAIRYIVDKYQLPEALRRESLLALSERQRHRAEKLSRTVDKLFDAIPLKLDLRSGVATVEFPEIDPVKISEVLPFDSSDQLSLGVIREKLVKRVAQISFCITHNKSASFNNAARYIYDMQSDRASSLVPTSNCMADNSPKVFEISGLCFEQLADSQGTGISRRWKIHRSPFKRKSMKLVDGLPLSSRLCHRISPTSESTAQSEASFSLWDDRYWIKVHNPAKHDLWVHPLRETSISTLRVLLSSGHAILRRQGDGKIVEHGLKYLDRLLRETAKGTVRWSLPVIVSYAPVSTKATADTPLKAPQILAFPTLGLRVEAANDGFWPSWVNELRWEVRYQNIALGNKKLEDCLVGSVARDGGKKEVG
ncbi:hypothetical protein FKW77_006859 [Venturia effusa]|uniref:tRNA(Ile)-lysidine synthetase n=1 Tax=Venturia effusa TaxID=50376 RepID=A0A517LFS8_9PEZI|nr:hypothetical protein FKW77_006859 [Venturia effusa]